MKYLTLIAAFAFIGACGSGLGPGASCNEGGLDFELVCPGDVAVGAMGQVTVEGYTASNINQLSFGAAGNGSISPLAFQVPVPADSTTNIPAAPYMFTFSGSVVGDIILTATTFDLSEDDCTLSKACNFDVVAPP